MQTITLPKAFKDLREPSRYKAFYGGRGSAKSHSFATALLMRGGESPLRILCAREVQLSIKDSVKQLLDDKINQYGMAGFYESLQSEIRGKNGTVFIFAGLGKMTTDQIKSMEGIDIAWVEEAQTISDKSLEILIPTIRKQKSELWFSWNPRHQSDPIDKRFRGEVTPVNSIIKKVNFPDNPFFPKELDEEREFDQKNNPERYGHIWMGDYEPTAIGAIWDRATLHAHRRSDPPEMNRIVVAVDPAVSEEGGDEHGIIVCGIGEDNRGYVLDDLSRHGSPKQWAEQTIAAYDKWSADAIVIEINQGGDMVRHTLESVRPGIRIIEVRATRGKHVRAEPISALYQLGRVSHAGTFDKLETQMCQVTSAGYQGDGSPDRVDAMVWAMTELFPKLNRQKPKKDHRENVSASWMG
tara:strand:+ start:3293 stop:4525 length:1233 start_codon:yes stop_codon:yes gene_type:complete